MPPAVRCASPTAGDARIWSLVARLGMTTRLEADATTSDEPKDKMVLRVRAKLSRLQEMQESGTRTARRGRWRPVVAGLLVVLAAILAPLSVLATWSHGQIQDTDRYLATVAPLANDPDVQEAVATRLEAVVFSYLDIDNVMDQVIVALETQGLPNEAGNTLGGLAGPLATGVQSFVSDRIDVLVRSDAFEQAWIEANRTAHQEFVAALNGETGGGVVIDRGAVSVNLATLINTLKAQLVEAGLGIAERIPEVDASFAIVQSDNLATAQTLLGVLEELSTWLPAIGLGLIGAAVIMARDRRLMVLVSGLAVAGSMLVLGAGLNALRPFYLDSLPASTSAAAAGAVYDQLVSFIRMALRGVLVVALTVTVVAWLSADRGPGATARAALARAIASIRQRRSGMGLDTGRLGMLLPAYRAPLRAGIVAIAALGYLARDNPTGGTALAFVLLVAIALLSLEVLASAPEEEPVEPAMP